MDMTFETPGLAEFEQMLLRMGTLPARGLGKKALRGGTNVITKEARRLAPQDTGLLRRSIVTRDRGVQGPNITFSVTVKMGKGWAFYAGWVEYGTLHASPRPFMRPAADGKKEESVAVMAQFLGDGLRMAWGEGA